MPAPLPYAKLSDPQTLNRYVYVRNNPLVFVDANGHGFWAKLGNYLFTDAECFCEGDEAKFRAVINRQKHRIIDEDRRREQAAFFGGERNMAIARVTSTIIFLGMGAIEASGDAGGAALDSAASTESTASVMTSEGATWIRVGRWMSQEELENMENSGVAQESRTLGGSRVAFPANADAYKNAPAGDVYVEYDIPAGVAKPAGSGWVRIPGPNSVEGRAATAAGRPAPEMPPVRNIEVIKSK